MTAFAPGVYNDVTDSDYRAAAGVANSDLKHIARSPAHYLASKLSPREQSSSMLAGIALHTAILEPHEMMARYVVLPPDAPRRPSITQINAKNPSPDTVAAIQWWAAWDGINAGKPVMSATDIEAYFRVGQHIRSHPELSGFLGKGDAETSIFATDPVSGVAVKCRPDWLCTVGGMVVCIDVKSCEDARPAAFQRAAVNYNYFQQAAYYQDVMSWCPAFAEKYGKDRPDLWLFCAFERDAPHGVKLYEVGQEAQERGRKQYRDALSLYAHCTATGEYPAYDTTIEPLDYPRWSVDGL